MKKWFFLLLGCVSLIYAQIRQYFIVNRQQIQHIFESTQRIEQEIQNLTYIFKKTFKNLPDDFLFKPYPFTKASSLDDLKQALGKAELHLDLMWLFVKEIADEYKYPEHPIVRVFIYHEKEWKKEIGKLLDLIQEYREKIIQEKKYLALLKQVPRLESSIYHPSVVVRRWQTQRPVPSVVAAEQRLSQLD